MFHKDKPVHSVPTKTIIISPNLCKSSIGQSSKKKYGHVPSIKNNTGGETNRTRKCSQHIHGPVKQPRTENFYNPNSINPNNIDSINPNNIVFNNDILFPSSFRDIHDYVEETIFSKFDQTNLTNSLNYYSLPLNDNLNTMDTQSGVNFLAYCNNLDFHDRIIAVIIPKGYYTDSGGQFTLNEELWELICPKCKQAISGNNVQGIGFNQCSVRVKYRFVDGVIGEVELKVDEGNFAFAKLSPPGNVRYFYVKFRIEILYRQIL